jgi:hypothetical protein
MSNINPLLWENIKEKSRWTADAVIGIIDPLSMDRINVQRNLSN